LTFCSKFASLFAGNKIVFPAEFEKHTHKLIYTSVFVQLFCSIIQIEAAQPEKKTGVEPAKSEFEKAGSLAIPGLF